jgi:glycosyltransferase involved in cell wall biosynthesis
MANPTVFVVIPVFNRIDATLHCLGDLREQTFPNVRIVVIDGGSTDDTVTQLSPMRDVHLISDVGEQWWTGATWFGIEHALQHGGDDDYVMLLNNDTRFGPEMVEVLVGESIRFDAAVAPIARAENGSVVNSGTWIDWSTYEITQRMVEPDEIEATWPVDVLEGRGSLVPLHAIRTAGNVDHERLPHYAGDYEFTLRLARHGCPLMMTNCTSIEVDWDLDVLLHYSQPVSFGRMWWELTNKRSFANVPIHFKLIDLAGPPQDRRRLKVRVLAHRFGWIRQRTPARHVVGLHSATLIAGRRALTRLRRVSRRQWWKLRN